MSIEFCEFDRDGDLLLLLTSPPQIDDTPPSTPPDTDFTVISTTTTSHDSRSSTTIVEALDQSEKCIRASTEVHMLVQSKALMLVSPVFRAMLRSNTFHEGNTLQETGKLSLSLPDDDPAAMRVLMDIAHHRNRQVPRNVSFRMLTQLAILVDKYRMLEAVENFAGSWVASKAIKRCFPDARSILFPDKEELLAWLCISWVFNLPTQFKYVTGVFMRHFYSEPVARLDGQDLPIPDTVIEKIWQTREEVILSALAFVEGIIKRYQGPGTQCDSRYGGDSRFSPQSKPRQLACDSQLLGSLLRASAAIAIWPPPHQPYSYMSWDLISTKLRQLEFRGLCDDYFDNVTWWPKRDPNYAESHGVKASIVSKLDSLDKLVKGFDLDTFKYGVVESKIPEYVDPGLLG